MDGGPDLFVVAFSPVSDVLGDGVCGDGCGDGDRDVRCSGLLGLDLQEGVKWCDEDGVGHEGLEFVAHSGHDVGESWVVGRWLVRLVGADLPIGDLHGVSGEDEGDVVSPMVWGLAEDVKDGGVSEESF